MNYDTAKLRQFIQEFFSSDELRTLLFDYFRPVHDNLTDGMTKNRYILLLLEYCHNHGKMPDLLAAIQRERDFFQPDDYVQGEKAFAADRPAPAPITRNPRQIFISHAHQDAEVAQRLAHDLESYGYDIWIAPDSIRPGEKWVEAINRGLEESGVFLLLISPEAVNSAWVKSEAYIAIELNHHGKMRFIPIKIRDANEPLLWRSYQQISYRRRSGLHHLLNELNDERYVHPMHPSLRERLIAAIVTLIRNPVFWLGVVIFSTIFLFAWFNFEVLGSPLNATKTPERSPTNTPTFTPTPLPTVPSNSDLLEIQRDDFSSLESDWDHYIVSKGSVLYDNREYSIEADPQVLFVGMWAGAGTISDRQFALQVDLLGYQKDIDRVEQGIIFGWHQDWRSTAYAFTFNSYGRCFFRESESGDTWTTTSSRQSNVTTSYNSEHTLFLVVAGNEAHGYIDGVYCNTIDLENYQSGLVGLASLGFQERTKSYFDNFVIYRFR